MAERRRPLRARIVPWLLLAPFGVCFLVLFATPLIFAFVQSLFVHRMIGGTVFAGAANYLGVVTDGKFWGSLGRILVYGTIMIPITLTLALTLALVLDSGRLRLAGFFRTAFFLPYAIPGVIATVMWGFLYSKEFGPLSQLAESLDVWSPDFLSSGWMLASIGNIGFWMYAGYDMVIFYTALQGLPQEVYEAARIDGAGAVRLALSIKVPLLGPALVMIGLFSIIGTLQLFTEPAVLAPLAPSVISSSYTPNYYAYTLAATGNQYNYVSALAFVLGAVVVAFSAIFFAATRRRQDVG